MRFSTQLMIGFLVLLGFGTLFVLFVVYLMKRTKTDPPTFLPLRNRYQKYIHDEKDKTKEQRKIHKRAGKSEYWERYNMNQGLYA